MQIQLAEHESDIYTYNWKPSMAIVAIVPSREMHKIQPRNGPASSPWNCTTLKRGVVKMVQRAASSKELYVGEHKVLV